MDSADSDEDYLAGVDEVDERFDELDSLVADSSEEDSSYEEDEEEEEEEDARDEEWRTVVKPRARNLATRSKRNMVKREEDEEESDKGDEEWHNGVKSRSQKGYTRSGKNRLKREVEEEDEGGWRTVVKPRVQMGFTRSRKNGLKKPKKRRKVTATDSEDTDDNDEDFILDDFDFLEEDEEGPFPRANKKRGRTTLKRNSSMTSQRRKRSVKTVQEPPKKRSKKTRSLKRKVECVDDEDFTDKCPALRTRGKKKPVHRNTRVADGSDSDILSDSSDYEFTISEEEREQVSRFNEISRSLKTNLRSSRRIQEDEALCKARNSLVRKGKEKAEETKNDVGNSVCGICLTEEGKKSIRGTLNCCNHYFCFACIMEWSKVESRCPVCKRRFATISKPARCVKGFDLRNVVIQVPERNQVYQPSEEELREFLNPYDYVFCTECHQGGDDALMLLCDLCDSPAHTYCVGLGREVPEGNWYCDSCRPAALGSSHSQTQALTPDRTASATASDRQSTYENMAEIDLNVTIPETPISQENGFLSSPRYSGGGSQAFSPVSRIGVSTVSGRRRRIRSRIWNMLSERASQAQQVDLSSPHPLLDRVNSTFQQSQTTDVGTSHHGNHVDRLHENSSYNEQNTDLFTGRMAQMAGHLVQASTSTNGSVRPCSTRSVVGPGSGVRPSHKRNEDHVNLLRQQVHLVVRCELKSLSRDMSLGHDAYAEISRRSVDTVMAACGLEPRRSDVYEAQVPICLHVERSGYAESCPMSGCCSTCFQNFVKDVVRRIMDITLGPHQLLFRH